MNHHHPDQTSRFRIGGRGKIPIIIIPGGPGFTDHYLEPFFQQLDQEIFKIFSYTPLGDRPPDPLDSIKTCLEEFTQLVSEQNLQNFYLIGHSFGGIIALEYLKENQLNVSAAVITNTFPSFKKYNQNMLRLRSTLPREVQEQVAAYEKKADFGEEFWGLFFAEFFPRFMFTGKEMPEAMQKTMQHFNQAQYIHFLGPNPSYISGQVLSWAYEDHFSDIKIPMLYVADDSDTVFWQSSLKKGKAG